MLIGICGNFNGEDSDDSMLPDGSPDAADDTVFGYAWKNEMDCTKPVSLYPCEENPDRLGWAEKGNLGLCLLFAECSHGGLNRAFWM